MKKYIVFYDVGKGKESHEIWASSAHNAEQMTIGYLRHYLGSKMTVTDQNILHADLAENVILPV